jgi:hypothetical protein
MCALNLIRVRLDADLQVLKCAVLGELVAGNADEGVSSEPAWGAAQLILDGLFQAGCLQSPRPHESVRITAGQW